MVDLKNLTAKIAGDGWKQSIPSVASLPPLDEGNSKKVRDKFVAAMKSQSPAGAMQ